MKLSVIKLDGGAAGDVELSDAVFGISDIRGDLLARTVRNTTAFPLDPDFAETPAGRDPLSASVDGFLAAVLGLRALHPEQRLGDLVDHQEVGRVAQIVIGLWQTTYNRVRPHSSLGYRPPAPVSYPDLAFRLPMAATMQ